MNPYITNGSKDIVFTWKLYQTSPSTELKT